MARYLKSVTLQGFKSFPLKTQVEFVDGITGIVGANGSGKSNIIESVKWVLGEQSAKSLRGDKMEDVIFNGTKNRTPMSMAEVSLNFENDNHWLPIEYNEVAISRRIFRSGEGLYSINKSKVRLKDIVEMFLDTGIGRDSYAIFEQGKIDRLLSESPQERRVLFEDFAGISKFKFRKEEAEKKLESARTNLERVNDIIIGLEKEVESLRGQAENASRYNELKSGLRDLELKFEAIRVKNFENEIMNKYSQKAKTEEKLSPLLEEIKKKEEDIVHAETDIQNRETDYNRIQEEYARFEREFGEVKSRLSSNKERKQVLETQLKNMDSRLKEGEDRQKALNGELETKFHDLDEVTEDKEAVQDKMTDIQSRIDAVHNQIRQLDAETLNRSKAIGFDKIVSKDDIDRQKHELVSVQAKLENYRASLEEKWNTQKNIQAELEEKQSQLGLVSQEAAKLKEELGKILSDIEQSHKKENQIKEESQRYNESIRSLQQKLKLMDKSIMESLEKQAVLIKDFSEKKPLLESKMESVMKALEDSIRNGKPLEETHEVLQKLKDHFSDYKNYYENILGILYSDEGTYTRKENMQNSIEELTEHIVENETALENSRAKVRELQSVREGIQNNFNKNEFEMNSLKNEMKKMNDQNTSVLEALKILENQINSASDTIKKKQVLIEEMAAIVDAYEEEIRDMKAERNEHFEELNKKKIDFARVEEKQKSVNNEIARIKNQLSDIERTRSTFENDKTNSLAIIEEMEKRITDDGNKLDDYQKKINGFQEDIADKKKEIEGIQKARKLMETQRKGLEESILKFEKVVMNLDSAVSERKGFLDSILENVQKSYFVDVRTIEIDKEDNLEEIASRISSLRIDLQNLGDVNLLAIEQFQNAKERLDFLLIQKQDSENAIEDIIDLINETNLKCVDQFSAAFEDIRKAFKKIFARLFDGGKADLVLDNDKDILNSGISIFAEPPGKKFQTISLLSGGERALVAIAVIFSILYLKPTPFVILDEMDAPLDDDNIERFKALLKDFKQTSQFVLVSHSKSTLEICDTLYGVTMEEQGVSKIVNVAFDEADLLFKTDENTPVQAQKEPEAE